MSCDKRQLERWNAQSHQCSLARPLLPPVHIGAKGIEMGQFNGYQPLSLCRAHLYLSRSQRESFRLVDEL